MGSLQKRRQGCRMTHIQLRQRVELRQTLTRAADNKMRFIKKALLPVCALALVCGFASIASAQGSGASVARSTAIAAVKPKAYVSLDPVPRGKAFEVAVVLSISSGYHMNSNKPLDDFLIPTTITAQFPAGFRPIDMDYPKGQLLKFAFSPDKPLSVYSGTVALRAKLEARRKCQDRHRHTSIQIALSDLQ